MDSWLANIFCYEAQTLGGLVSWKTMGKGVLEKGRGDKKSSQEWWNQ